MQNNLFRTSKYRFFSLGSGSSGNCYYLGCPTYGILIDAGIGMRSVRKTLTEYGVSFDKIMGVLVTHDHADHVKAVGYFGDKCNIPVYATKTVHEGISRNKYIQADLITSKRVIEKEQTFSIKDFEITAFSVPHDSLENVGYHIKVEDKALVLVTDIGQTTDTIARYASDANFLVIEANYDEEMLRQGRYPHFLKQRITSGLGHLSNKSSAEFIANIYTPKMENIWLCHLSQDNNHPDLAYRTVEEALRNKGIIVGKDLDLQVLSRYKASGLKDF